MYLCVQGGKGHVKGVLFEHITLNNTGYPIFIDQHYMHNPEQVPT